MRFTLVWLARPSPPCHRDSMRLVLALLAISIALGGSALAQSTPPISTREAQRPAKDLFSRATRPASTASRPEIFGSYARGCISGAVALPTDGPNWQAMRLSRNRNCGHPALISVVTRLSREAAKATGWPGILVGDFGQPRGGPSNSDHASHQIGLDADIWLTPMPARTLSTSEREHLSAVNMVASDWNDVDPAAWTAAQRAFIRVAAQQPEVERILVNPAIKKALCRDTTGDRGWLHKVRPYWGHNTHMHLRIACPPGNAHCRAQAPTPRSDGCDATLDWWFTAEARAPYKGPKKPPLKLSDLPPQCRAVLTAP